MRAMKTRNPYGNTKKRKAALAYMAAHGITEPRGIGYQRMVKVDTIVNVTIGPLTAGRPVDVRKMRLI